MRGSEARTRKVLLEGTPHQRITLLGSYIAHWVEPEEPELLTDEEFKALEDSFKTDFELKVYFKFKKLDECFRVVVMGLQQLSIEFNLRETQFALWNETRRSLQQMDDAFGAVECLVSEHCGEEKQIAIWKELVKTYSSSFPLGAKPKLKMIRENGKKYARLDFPTLEIPKSRAEILSLDDYGSSKGKSQDFSYTALLKICGDKLTRIRRDGKTQIAVLREVIEEHSFHIQPYKRFLDRLELKFRKERPITVIKDLASIKSELGASEDKKFRSRMEKHIVKPEEEAQRLFFIPYDEIEIDKELYKTYRELFNRSDITNGPK